MPHRHLTPPAKPGPPREPPTPPPRQPQPVGGRWLFWWILMTLIIVLLLARARSGPHPAPLSYSDFVGKVGTSQVQVVDVNDKGAISGTLKNGTKFTTQIPTALNTGAQLQQQLTS
ncbi:ATP-dependent metallopeptidase FtsH/Yme1/Tma family protein, partial [Streptomyces sp. NPDC002164]|uniref:ATP-dependent metallopeptidase FtsH/Yme1/Tma family protein n=1 Tax=Streptomyces sp. NPDC002164 TaxID=3364633 RepID=UPI0036B25706